MDPEELKRNLRASLLEDRLVQLILAINALGLSLVIVFGLMFVL